MWRQICCKWGDVMRRATAVIALVILLSGGTLVGADHAVIIGAVYPTGGAQGSGGLEEFRGVGLAADYANRQGGWHGRPLRLELVPAESWDAAPGAVERLHQAGLTIVVGSYGSTISRPAAETASHLGMVFWETGAVGEWGMATSPGTRVFRFVASGSSLGRAAVAFIRDQLAPRLPGHRPLRYAVAYVDDVYGRAVGLGAVAEINDSGRPLVAVLPYDLQHVNYDDQARQIGQARADILVVASYMADAVALRRALARAKVPLLASIGTSSSFCMPTFGHQLGKEAVGLFASDKPDGGAIRTDRLTLEARQALQWGTTAYRRRYGSGMSAAALSGFAGGLALFQHVLPLAPELSAEAVAQAARQVRLPDGSLPNGAGLALAPPGSPEAGENLRAARVIWEWIGLGTRAVVWPPAFATYPIMVPQSAR
jgi:branched-chain amino acid transport system substrate-binding protein